MDFQAKQQNKLLQIVCKTIWVDFELVRTTKYKTQPFESQKSSYYSHKYITVDEKKRTSEPQTRGKTIAEKIKQVFHQPSQVFPTGSVSFKY